MRIFILTIAIIAGFVAGWLVSPIGRSSNPEMAESKPFTPTDRPTLLSHSTIPVSANRGSITEQLEMAFESGKIGYSETRLLIGVLSLLSPDTVPEFAAFFRDQSMEKEQLFLWKLFFSAWGLFDPQGAIAFIDNRFQQANVRRFFHASVVDTWKGKSIGDAFEFALGNHESGANEDSLPDSRLAIDYLRSLAEHDPEKALGLAMKLNDAEFVLEMTARRISQLSEVDRNAALEAIDTLSGDTHLHAASQYLIDWAKQEPANAASWLAANFDDRFGLHVLGQIARSFVKADPKAAIKWIENMPDGQERTEILAEAVKEWAQFDPAATVNWLGGIGKKPEYDSALVAFSHHLAQESPQQVIEEWVPRVFDPQKSNALLSEVSSEWQRSNPADFSNWLDQTQVLPNEVKQRLLAREAPGPTVQAESEAGSPQNTPADTGIDQGRDR